MFLVEDILTANLSCSPRIAGDSLQFSRETKKRQGQRDLFRAGEMRRAGAGKTGAAEGHRSRRKTNLSDVSGELSVNRNA